MYIKEIKISNFRNFRDTSVPFHREMNVIIDHNDTGRSNSLRAIDLVLGYSNGRRLGTCDLFYEIDAATLQRQPPQIRITLIFYRSQGEALDSAEMGLFSGMMTDPALSEEIKLRYRSKLADNQGDNYKADAAGITTAKKIWKIIDRDYIKLYRNSHSGGNQATDISVNDTLGQMDLQFLGVIRGTSHDLYAGYNPLLRGVLSFFIDYSVRNDTTGTEDEIKEQLRTLRDDFVQQPSPLIQTPRDRLHNGKNVFLKYALDIGATFNRAMPDFDGEVTENETFAVLRIIIEYTVGIEVPAAYSELGYNNLICTSLLLVKIQVDSSITYMRRSAKVISSLAVEECEAHLHSAMQYKFLQFLQGNKANGHVRQVFMTSHSTQIASAVKLDDLICLTPPVSGQIDVGYSRVIYKEDSDDDVMSKQYVQRFIDATKADMFFANELIFVEGIAEGLLLPVFARYLNKNFIGEHMLVVSMGGRHFSHLLKLFGMNNPYTINRRIVCLTDVDPCRKKSEPGGDYEAYYPYGYNIDTANYNYKYHTDTEVTQRTARPNIRFYKQDVTYGETLGYDIIRESPDCELLLTNSVSNLKEIKAMMAEQDMSKIMSKMRDNEANTRIKTSVGASKWTDEEKRKALLASRYLNSVSKGSNALELNVVLVANLDKPVADRKGFRVPQYTANALTWLLS